MSCSCGYAIGHPLVPVCTCKERKQREWKGLTKKEYEAIRYGSDENGNCNVDYETFDEGEYGMQINIYVDAFYRAIEQALKEKNCG